MLGCYSDAAKELYGEGNTLLLRGDTEEFYKVDLRDLKHEGKDIVKIWPTYEYLFIMDGMLQVS